MYVEKSISDMDSKLMIHRETLKKLMRKVDIVQQLHNAPDLYALAVVEVVRRKAFSQTFMQVRLTHSHPILATNVFCFVFGPHMKHRGQRCFCEKVELFFSRCALDGKKYNGISHWNTPKNQKNALELRLSSNLITEVSSLSL